MTTNEILTRAAAVLERSVTLENQTLAAELRRFDTSQREALARVEADRDRAINDRREAEHEADVAQTQLAEAVGLLVMFDSSGTTHPGGWDGFRKAAQAFLARYAQAEQQEARHAEIARESLRPENQRIEPVGPLRVPHPLEAQGAQAGDGYFASPEEYAEQRAALATQPAAGEPVAWMYHHESLIGPPTVRYERRKQLSDKWTEVPLYTAPPAAAHGDEAVRKDAERYRWVREPSSGNKVWAMITDGECGRNMDAAIDAAMRAQGDGGEA